MSGKTIPVTVDNFQTEVVNSTVPVVVDFWAPWCGPCRVLGPVLETLAEQYAGKVKVAKVNVDQEPTLASSHGIRGIPTMVVYNQTLPVQQIVGFPGPAVVRRVFDDLTQLAPAKN